MQQKIKRTVKAAIEKKPICQQEKTILDCGELKNYINVKCTNVKITYKIGVSINKFIT